jgi:hypothetical protein
LELLLPRHVSRADVSRDDVLNGYNISRGTLLEILPNRKNSATNLEENDVSRGPKHKRAVSNYFFWEGVRGVDDEFPAQDLSIQHPASPAFPSTQPFYQFAQHN